MTRPPRPGATGPGAPADSAHDRRARIDTVFDEALDCPVDRRAEWVAERCGEDEELRREVNALLEAHDRTGGILDDRRFAAAAASVASTLATHADRGRQIGPYRVLRELGRGGMGVVYLAERSDGQFRRRVAVKLLRATGDADELLQRFLTERQILASLSHPNIAALLDGGVTDGQLPYLVIEYVEGLPITEYCDRHRLGVDARLRLFQDVCAAVHHAHRNLVLHRDLKPGNVLVTTSGQVKLLDFGIAKILNPSLAVYQPVTRTAFRLMTPAYASPEQVRGDSLTTASDVYALGLLLYELLAGVQSHQITSDAPHALIEAICEQEPERPSVRLARTGSATGGAGEDDEDARVERTAAAIAAERDTTPERLRRRLRGDLDAITMMALRKEPARRYGSAELLAADVARHFDGLPVLAHRGSRWYRASKLLGRHRGIAVATALAAVALVVGASAALWQAGIAARERDRATAALGSSERALRQSEEVTAFLVALFEASDPSEGRRDTLTAADLLRRGAARAERLTGEPLVQARMLEALGRVHASLGDVAPASELMSRALTLRRRHLGDDDIETAATAALLADLLMRRGAYRQADSLARHALAVRLAKLGDAHDHVAASLRQLGSIAVYLGDLLAAEEFAREAVAVRQRGEGLQDTLAVQDLTILAAVLWRRGDQAGTERTLREALAVSRQARPSPHVGNASVLIRLADRLDQRPAARAEAESLARAAVAEMRAALGDEHPQTASLMEELGMMLARHGRRAEAERLLRHALDVQRRANGPTHTRVAGVMDALSSVLIRDGRIAEAEGYTREAFTIWEAAYGPHHSAFAEGLQNIANILALRGALDSAETLQRRALAIRVAALGDHHPLTALTAGRLAEVLTRQRRYAEADSILQSALVVLRRQIADTHIDVRRTYARLDTLYTAWGKPEDAARYRRLAEP